MSQPEDSISCIQVITTRYITLSLKADNTGPVLGTEHFVRLLKALHNAALYAVDRVDCPAALE